MKVSDTVVCDCVKMKMLNTPGTPDPGCDEGEGTGTAVSLSSSSATS